MEQKKISSSLTPTPFHSSSDFSYFFILAGLWLVFESGFFLLQLIGFLHHDVMLGHLIEKIPASLIVGVLGYVFLYIGLHLLLTLLLWCGHFFLMRSSHWYIQHSFTFTLIIWLTTRCWLLAANQHWFVNSAYADMLRTLVGASGSYFLFLLTTFLVLLWISAILFYAVKKLVRIPYALHTLFVFSLMGFFAVVLFSQVPQKPEQTILSQPNIILIGIDSLRVQDTAAFGGSGTHTPYLDHFLKNTSLFTQTSTPLAQTFPAWVSILTGYYPKQHGARFDLDIPTAIKSNQSIAHRLKEKGYKTIYATDETRFSNIDVQFGFNTLITPPMGAYDFILGTFGDFPLLNLLSKFSWGYKFFPYNYANRAQTITYHPQQFLAQIDRSLTPNVKKPVFLAMHLCLSHWPYLWAETPVKSFPPENTKELKQLYYQSLRGVDQQLSQLMAMLQQKQLLNNAIVVLLSDHGEGLVLPRDRDTQLHLYKGDIKRSTFAHLVDRYFYPRHVEKTIGHGNDVLSTQQYHVLMAWKRFGSTPFLNQRITHSTSLIDIVPTLYTLLGIDTSTMPGKSLTDLLFHRAPSAAPSRLLFLETGYWPTFPDAKRPEEIFSLKDLFRHTVLKYQINPTTQRLVIRAREARLLTALKQHAVMNKDWLLAEYPTENPKKPIYVLLNRHTGEWTDDRRSQFAHNSPLISLTKALHHFYGDELP